MTEPTGTANILHQHTEYEKLRADYNPAVANTLVQKNLARKNVEVTPEHVEGWHLLNNAAVSGKLDVKTERKVAETLAATAGAAILAMASGNSETKEVVSVTSEYADEEVSDQDEEVSDQDEEASDQDEEASSLADMYGYENDEDNEEAALDDVLKIQERDD